MADDEGKDPKDPKDPKDAARDGLTVPLAQPVPAGLPPVPAEGVPDPDATVLSSEAYPRAADQPGGGATTGAGDTVLYPRLGSDGDRGGADVAPYAPEDLSHGAQLQGQVPIGDYDSPAARAKAAGRAYDHVPGEGKSRSHARPIVVALLLLLVLGVAAAGVSWGMELWGGRTIPGVAGKTQAAATQELESRGFVVEVEGRPVDDGIGKAIETSPEAGSRQDEGSQVTLVVGVARTIPQVSGMTLDEAKQALQDAGAENFQISYASSDEAEGTVIAVDPPEGSAFVSRDTVTITVSQPYTVPYVMGKTEEEAKRAVTEAGLNPHVTYAPSDKAAGVVVAVSPDQGTRITSGATVELSISQPQPSDYLHLLEYFSCTPKVLTAYLASQGFGIQNSYVDEEGLAAALYASSDHGTLTVTSTPFLPGLAGTQGVGEDVLDGGADFGGVRLDLAEADYPTDLGEPSEAAVRAVMAACGFDNLQELATNDTMAQLPVAADLPAGASFACGYGDAGNGVCWSVLVERRGDQTSVVAMAADKTLLDGYDLSEFDGSLCGLIAYADLTSR